MKFTCEKSELSRAIATAQRAVASKSSIPALEGILLEANEQLTVSGYNMSTGIRTVTEAQITETGSLVLNARIFGEIVRRLPDDTVSFSSGENLAVHLTCGDAAFDIPGIGAEDFPALPAVDSQFYFSVAQNTLRSILAETGFAISTNESRPIHTGSLFEVSDEGLTVVSVDGFRLALRREPLERKSEGGFSFVAPGSALSEVEKICAESDDLVEVTQGQRHVLFRIGNTELICRRLEGDFLDYKKVIPRNNPVSLIAETKDFIESIDRVSVVISEKMKSPLRCTFGQNKVLFSVKTGIGEAKDVCPLAGDGGDLEIGFNNRYLADAFRFAPASQVKIELSTAVSPCIIVPTEGEENFLYMVLPVRLQA